jgi:L-malate glycosyltransferase
VNILFYTVANKRSRDIESQALAFASEGNRIFLLTQSPHSILHDFFQANGFTVQSRTLTPRWFPIHVMTEIWALIRYCHQNNIDIIHSHLDPCNLIAVLAQYFMRAKVVVTRHHADALVFEASPKAQRTSRLIYQGARHIVAVSENAKHYMVNVEKINPEKIQVIPLSFNFQLYTLPEPESVLRIRHDYPAQLLLICVGRLSPLKRMDQVIDLTHQLFRQGIDVKLLLLGQGPEEEKLKHQANALGMKDRIVFIGFTHNVLDYLAACDIYVHLSITEASCTTVKEAALTHTPVIVCRGVGDFDSYIQHGENGLLVSREEAVAQAAEYLLQHWQDKPHWKNMGENLFTTVTHHFNISHALPLYDQLHLKIKG